jgi:hypothetical protein
VICVRSAEEVVLVIVWRVVVTVILMLSVMVMMMTGPVNVDVPELDSPVPALDAAAAELGGADPPSTGTTEYGVVAVAAGACIVEVMPMTPSLVAEAIGANMAPGPTDEDSETDWDASLGRAICLNAGPGAESSQLVDAGAEELLIPAAYSTSEPGSG